MIVVSDTSPLTSLITIGKASILESLFGEVWVPVTVWRELLAGHAVVPDYIKVKSVNDDRHVLRLAAELDRGEAEAIVLAKELRADVLLMDEKQGRRIAALEGLKVIGVMGVLVMAKKKGLLRTVGETLVSLQREAGFRVSDDVVRAVLSAAGES